MIYYKKVNIEDNDILKDVNLTKLAKKIKTTQSYLSYVKNHRYIVTEETYLKIKQGIENNPDVKVKNIVDTY